MIASQNSSASLYSISSYQRKFSAPHPGYQIFKNFPTPRLLSFEEFFNPMFIPIPLLLGSQEYDRRVALSIFLFPTNRSAVLFKNSLSFSVFGIGTKRTMYDFPYIILIETLFCGNVSFSR